MKKYPVTLISLLFLAISITSHAQPDIYQTKTAYLSKFKVIAYGSEKTNAWAGGQNSPQFAIADMNRDGKNDLMTFEQGKGVKVYANTGTVAAPIYKYAPEYEYKFPKINNYLKLIDYNCDNVPDLFHFGDGTQGLVICDGFYDASDILTFKSPREIRFFRQGQPNSSNVNIRPTDIPSIEDIDGDGDLDVVTYSLNGNYITSWQNVTKEDGLPCDSFRLRPGTGCWGKVIQDYPRTHILGATFCPPFREDAGNRTNHGNNALCLLDIDGDGDLDFLDGNGEYSDIQLLINGKADYQYPIDSIVAQDTLWQKNGKQLYMPKFPSAFWVDIDQDGDRDIMISPKQAGTENYRCIALYNNQGTSTAPNYVYHSDTFLMETMVDLGAYSYPVIYDYNKDGLQDLLVGTLGRYNPIGGNLLSRIAYYQNTGTALDPLFTLVDDNFLDLETMGLEGAALAIGDLDNDGLDELFIGRKGGNIAYFKNYAANGSLQPDWRLWQRELTDQNSKIIRANNFAAPIIYDVNKDGVKDLICGSTIGYLYYYQNMATAPGQMKLLKKADSLGKLKVGPYQQEGFSAPFIGKIDNTGKEYLMLGAKDGTIQRWEGIDSGDPDKAYTLLDTFYSNIKIQGLNAAPVFADMNGDDKYELFIGNDLGGINLYEQVWNVSVDDLAKQQNELSLYPNPAIDILNVGLNSKVIPSKSVVKIYSSMGQLLSNIYMQYRDNAWRVDISSLPAGIYLCFVYCDGVMHTARFSKAK